jgi:hypothetical protein
MADILQNERSKEAWDRISRLLINSFEDETHDAVLVRYTKRAYEVWIQPFFRVKKVKRKTGERVKTAISYMRPLFCNNVLCRLPSSRIPGAVGLHHLWTRENNPHGTIGQNIPAAYQHSIGVEFSEEDYSEFEQRAMVLHWDLYQN